MSINKIGFEVRNKETGKTDLSFYYDGTEFHLKANIKITDKEDLEEILGKISRYFEEAPENFQ